MLVAAGLFTAEVTVAGLVVPVKLSSEPFEAWADRSGRIKMRSEKLIKSLTFIFTGRHTSFSSYLVVTSRCEVQEKNNDESNELRENKSLSVFHDRLARIKQNKRLAGENAANINERRVLICC